MRKKILIILATCLCTTALFIGCGNKKDNSEQPSNQEISMESKLLEYNEEGMNFLKLNYPTNKDMELALRNIGNDIPDLTLNKLDGSKLNLKKLRGKNVLLEVVQTDCSYCLETTPMIHKVLSERNDIEFIPIFINANTTEEAIEGYYNETGVQKHPNTVIDKDNVTVSTFGLSQTPSLIYIDTNGKISFVKQSRIDEQTFRDDLAKGFGEEKIYNKKINK